MRKEEYATDQAAYWNGGPGIAYVNPVEAIPSFNEKDLAQPQTQAEEGYHQINGKDQEWWGR